MVERTFLREIAYIESCNRPTANQDELLDSR